MQVFHDEATLQHHPPVEIHRGQILSPFEKPERVESIIHVLSANENAALQPCHAFDAQLLERIHSPDYLQFLKSVYADWQAADVEGHVVPHAPRRSRPPSTPRSQTLGEVSTYLHGCSGAAFAAAPPQTRRSAL